MTLLTDVAIARLREAAVWPELPDDRYSSLRLLARGGMGTVYAARDARLDRDVAIKVSNAASPVAGDAALDRRLAEEARILARLEHPGIVPVHDAGTLADGRRFYVMKLVRGRTLADSLDAMPDLPARLAAFQRIVETVAFAHAAGVVHRDLTPSNVMIGGFGEVLVLDWGVARVVPPNAAPADADAGLRIGTPGFMAPEQRDGGAAAAGPEADVYALGAILEWLIGATPVHKRLRAIAQRCRAGQPSARYASAGVLAEDLDRFRAGHPVSAYRDTWLDRAQDWLRRYGGFVALIAAYLLMRAAFAFFSRP